MQEIRIGGVLRAKGVLSEAGQKAVRQHCERGNAAQMIVAVADTLLVEAMAAGAVPQNAGIKTQELLDRTEEALRRIAETYHERGGVLTAKGYVSIDGLAREMAKQWAQSFSAPIPAEFSLKGTLGDPEIQDRLTLVALKLRQLVIETADTYDAETKGLVTSIVSFDEEKLEGLCQRAAIEMFQAFERPNETNHELIHKEKP
jgi:hypothetical protein